MPRRAMPRSRPAFDRPTRRPARCHRPRATPAPAPDPMSTPDHARRPAGSPRRPARARSCACRPPRRLGAAQPRLDAWRPGRRHGPAPSADRHARNVDHNAAAVSNTIGCMPGTPRRCGGTPPADSARQAAAGAPARSRWRSSHHRGHSCGESPQPTNTSGRRRRAGTQVGASCSRGLLARLGHAVQRALAITPGSVVRVASRARRPSQMTRCNAFSAWKG